MFYIILSIIFIFFLGASMGSFISAAAYRMRRKETLLGRSRCPMCGYKLGFSDLFPVFSFLLLKGKCRRCFKKIDVEYFLTEIASGAIFVFSFFYRWTNAVGAEEFGLAILRDWLFLAGLIFIFIYDYKYQEIPDIVSIPLAVLLFGINYSLGAPLGNLILGAAAGGGFFATQYVVSRGRWIGSGDIRMGALLGAALGWPNVAVAIFIAYVLGGAYGGYLLLRKRAELKTKIAFGTFLAIGGAAALFWGGDVINWYFNLL